MSAPITVGTTPPYRAVAVVGDIPSGSVRTRFRTNVATAVPGLPYPYGEIFCTIRWMTSTGRCRWWKASLKKAQNRDRYHLRRKSSERQLQFLPRKICRRPNNPDGEGLGD
ncbi:UNVERIFIED_CONTAM: hypothetical protein K2H54_045276 [Gekko kuhli]